MIVGRTADARSSNGTPLFNNPCPECGLHRLSDKRRIGKLCMACSNRSRATHGLCGHELYKKLNSIRVRCEYPSATNYKYYGGRGIKVCDEWRKNPAAFVEWAQANGYVSGLEIDRIDNDGDYEPGNCRFIPHVTNSRKRSNARCDERTASDARALLTSGRSVADTARDLGIPYMVAWHISKGNTWCAA